MAGSTIKGLTIEIGGNTQPLNKALGEVNTKTKSLQTELKQVERMLKLDPKNTELLAQKQKILSEAVGSTKEKLDALKEAEKQVQVQFEKGEVGEAQYRALQREIIATEKDLEKLEDQLAEVNSKWKKAGEAMQDVGGKVTKVGKGMTVGVTTPILAIGAASQMAFNEVDAGLDTIVTKTGATGKAMDALQESFNKVYGNIPADAQMVGDAIGEVNTQFGLMGEELEEVSSYAIKFSQINNQDVTSSVIDAKAAMEAFEMTTKDIPSIMDAITKTAQNTGVATDKLFDSVIKGAPQLKSLGLDFAQSAELIGRFEQKGLDSSKALSYLAKAQVTWAKDGKTMAEGLEELTKKIQDSQSETDKLTLASEAFGTKGATFMLDAIQRGALDFEDFAGAAENAAGAVQSTFEGTLDPVDKATVAMNNLKLAGSDLSSSIQEAMAPILEKLVVLLQNLAEWFNSLPDGVKQFIVVLAGLLAAIGPIIVIIGTLISSLGTIIAFFAAGGAGATAFGAVIAALTGPVGIAIAIIGGLIAIGVLLYKNWDEIKAKAGEIKDAIAQKFSDIKSAVTDKINGAKDAVKNAIEKIKGFFKFDWELPKIKLPHFDITGKFSLNPPQIPKFSVEWYKQGAIFNRPTIIGVGEAGQEAVLPIEKIDGIIAAALQKVGSSGFGGVIVQNMYVRSDDDILGVAAELYRLQEQAKRKSGGK